MLPEVLECRVATCMKSVVTNDDDTGVVNVSGLYAHTGFFPEIFIY